MAAPGSLHRRPERLRDVPLSPEDTESPAPASAAAVDLGSNSFHMVIARVVGEQVQIVDAIKEGVRLAAYLDERGRVTDEGRRRALACLERFGQRVRELPGSAVRAVGTNTLRKMKRPEAFLRDAESALGHSIDIISGQEEARLVYLGVCQSLPPADGRRLVMDIGGGSTEVMVGRGEEPEAAESLYMGCVGFSLEFFPEGEITPERMDRAILAAQVELEPVAKTYRRLGWSAASGSSGTIKAIHRIGELAGWSERGITPESLTKIRHAVVAAGHVHRLSLDGLSSNRAAVFAGGVAILSAIFKSLKVERLSASSGALREGALYDLLGRLRHEDARDRTIRRFVRQYHVDEAQAAKVEGCALALLEQVQAAWELEPDHARPLLSRAARLHEIGLAVAHGGFHKHGAYLVATSDMPGFSFQEQRLISHLLRAERRTFPEQEYLQLAPEDRRPMLRLAVLFRIACLLHRGRSSRAAPIPEARADGDLVHLRFPSTWLADHPLTRADLDNEAAYLKAVGLELRFE